MTAFAPGRVNLLGEHTDYNEGFVLPMALERGVTVTVELRREGGIEIDADARPYAEALATAAGGLPGFRATIESDLPAGAGLASSAALTVALARALRDAGALEGDDRALALLAHRAEADVLGVRCGVMDQMVAALGRPGRPLVIDCQSLRVRPAALPDDVEVLVLDSGVRHSNAGEGYQRRRDECEEACRILGVPSLRAVGATPEPDELPPPLDRRVRHVVSENARVIAACEEPWRLPGLMRGSHASQRDDYEVSVPEVDDLVERAERHGALGARLTGGGFGGAVVALCRRGEARAVGERVGAGYVLL